MSGFSLVEIVLAILVLSIGVLVVIGLFPSGLQQSKKSIDETRAAMFAEQVLNSVKAKAADLSWDDIDNMEIIVPTKQFWEDAESLTITAGSDIQTYSFSNKVTETFAVKFMLEFTDVSPTIKGVKLQVVNGEHMSLENGELFYTEIYYTELRM